ncbi:membrane transport protein-domain-containing protein [Daldinia vernicosa]|uniref:membrane transport protein-domain-containing protein n=1 Tax=Daldinia vernicosa TaxID=114800 RepID=UPI0020085526|nr:membrane transport protein-domain-containing protein [Daldinia vernicosa]KAI0851392.1 membrane transport protein-domain-containing protein [Daldinia vernicosa]
MVSPLLVSFLGAIQASLLVLLTISYGVIAAQFGLVTTDAAREVSHLCVTVLLPCLLITKLGSQLHLDTVVNYVPIIIWAIIFTVSSIAIGKAAVAFFRLPKWALPAIAFNNTESLPLLLLQSLETTGVLATLVGAGQASDGIERARTYFLACSVINNTITFSQGAKWITGDQHKQNDSTDPEGQRVQENGQGYHSPVDFENGDDANDPNERTSLLPKRVVSWERRVRNKLALRFRSHFRASPKPVQKTLAAIGTFANPPFIGATIGIIIGLTPPLHRLFFNDMDEGGYFNAVRMNTADLDGELFVSLQVIVVGVELSLSLRRMKEGEEAGTLPLGTVLSITFVRFILWPAISIPLIWVLAAYTGILPNDPMLWWTLMMMPIGPTAMKVLALADISGADQKIRMSIAKFLTLSYIITPIVSFAVVGALEAAKAAKE